MPITDKLSTNPELVQLNVQIANLLEALIDRKWGSVTMTISCQNGRIKTLKVIDEAIFTFKNE